MSEMVDEQNDQSTQVSTIINKSKNNQNIIIKELWHLFNDY